jgi:uncharacterized protein (TIGR02391 family)
MAAKQLKAENLPEWFILVSRQTRKMREFVLSGVLGYANNDSTTVKFSKLALEDALETLDGLWFAGLPQSNIRNLRRHISFAEAVDYDDMIGSDLPGVETDAETHFSAQYINKREDSFQRLLHPAIIEHAYDRFQHRNFHDAVLNSIMAVLEIVRQRGKLVGDGANLINEAFGGNAPRLVFSTLKTESGRDEQKGFHKILLGACEGIRNPKAHSLIHDLDDAATAQYLVFASLLARRVDESKRSRSGKKPARS